MTFRELRRALIEGGADFANLLKITVYITQLDQAKLQAFRVARDALLDASQLPASTVVGVHSLFNDAAIEIDAVAVV